MTSWDGDTDEFWRLTNKYDQLHEKRLLRNGGYLSPKKAGVKTIQPKKRLMKPPQVRVSKHVALQDPQINISFLQDSLMLHYLAKKLNTSTQGNAFLRINDTQSCSSKPWNLSNEYMILWMTIQDKLIGCLKYLTIS